ncbi:trypsin-like peptidase domain-containing protein [Candidatus Poribacteria bacterium]|nr:trypsin-like peptidase domain-containing protein [Candidatus Poribacteria bacterium]
MKGKFIPLILLTLTPICLCSAWQEEDLPPHKGLFLQTVEQIVDVVRQVDPSVVTVKNDRPQFATGVIYNADGYVLTTRLIIEGAERLEVILPSGLKYKATPIGIDGVTGIGVIKITAPDLRPVKFGDSDRLKKGESILVIGDSFGLSRSLSTGVISNLDLEVNGKELIQITAPINPSMGGAPMINSNGEVVGIIQARLSGSTSVGTSGSVLRPSSEEAEGTGFAVPINDIKFAVKQLIEKGVVTRSWLGVEVQSIPDALRAQLSLENSGVLVTEVLKDSPAQRAGIKRWDIILEYQGKPIDGSKALRKMVYRTPPGTEVELLILRRGNRKRIKAKLEASQGRPTGPIPADFTINAFPDAERGGAWITYTLPWKAHLTLSIYDLKGKLIRRIDLGEKRPGYYITKEKAVYWDGKDKAGKPTLLGIYICTLESGKGRKITTKLLHLGNGSRLR